MTNTIIRHLKLNFLLAAFALLTSNAAFAQTPRIFLDIEGLEGSSTNAHFKDKIDIVALAYQGVTLLTPDANAAGGASAGDTHASGINLTFRLDPKAFPALFLKCMMGEAFRGPDDQEGFKITVTSPLDTSKKVYELEIKGRYESISQETNEGADTDYVNMQVRPTEIKITTYKYKANGNVDGTETATWTEHGP